MLAQSIQCPECESNRIWKAGLRNTTSGQAQRYLYRDCGYRFSDPENSQKNQNTSSNKQGSRQICVTQTKGTKNLVEVEPRIETWLAGATKQSNAEIKGKVVEVIWKLKKEGYSKSTIYSYSKFLGLLTKYGANLFDPESVKEVIAKQNSWGNSSKMMAVAAYTMFASINEIPWNPPKYKPKRQLPFIPLENEIDSLIARAGKKLATSLQLVKETGMRIGEACKLKWINVDLQRNTITVNDPEKGSNPRMFKVSCKLTAMINNLPRTNDYVFGKQKPRSIAVHLRIVRMRLAKKLQNPRLNHIHFHTLRHWKATVEYHKTKNLLHVMQMLGHRDIKSTMIYTHLIELEGDEYHSAVAKTTEEAKELIETGFEYVCTHQDLLLFRKRK